MNKELEKILSKPWTYYIARNLPIWHNSAYYIWGDQGFKKYGLELSLFFRIQKGDLSEFYVLRKGRRSIMEFNNLLADNFKDPDYIKFLINGFCKDCNKLVRTAKETVFKYSSFFSFFVVYGMCESMLDITSLSSKFLTAKLTEILKDIPERAEIMAYYTIPTKLAPVQRLEKEAARVIESKGDLLVAARRLHKKYYWIPVGFCGEPWGVEYFRKLLASYKSENHYHAEKPKVKITKEARYYLKLLQDITFLNEFRKAAFSKACLAIRPLLDQIAKKYGLGDWKALNLLTHVEILDLINGKSDYQQGLIEKRKRLCALYFNKIGELKFLYSDDVKKFENKFRVKLEGIKELKGVIANRGKVSGKAKIVSGPIDFHKFVAGDVLVAKMTSVDFIPIMKKASAFVTDEGGLACHAAVISREYNVPCIVGTGLATQFFKDDDVVVVDAEKGIVKKV